MRYDWIKDRSQWIHFWSTTRDDCDQTGMCGNYGLCVMKEFAQCNCLTGFIKGDYGCVRKNALDCVNGTDGFVVMTNIKLPQSDNCKVDLSLRLDQCRNLCLSNCSCTAYASAIAANDSGCAIWTGNLNDIRSYDLGIYGRDLYLRLNATDVPQGSPDGKSHGKVVVVVVSLVAGILLLSCAGGVLCIRKMKKRKTILDAMSSYNHQIKHEQNGESMDLPIFNFDTIITATNNFSSDNKLGEGGFGPVYKGRLEDDQEIAVKRLSRTSSQGLEEFKTELMLIAKLQHKNLVRLLGCCIEGEERMLIYEYLSNGSLDTFLFDEKKRLLINWNTRYKIIIGIAKGILYLHHDSRFRIIHRDLKAGNILLNKEMIPKISDFGLARIFNDDETDLNTRRIVGTYGYMSPEYVLDGVFSLKSDVYSFGVLVLEIISAKKNKGVYAILPHINLLAYAWNLWKEGNGMQLVDDSMSDSCSNDEVLKCVQLGLLCVQEHPKDRPLISSVVQMFGSDMKTIPQPKQPGFVVRRYNTSSDQDHCSNELSVTKFEPR